MNPLVAAIISSLSCSEPPMAFRQLYVAVHSRPLAPLRGESVHAYVERVAEAGVDFLDYRAAYADKCGRRE